MMRQCWPYSLILAINRPIEMLVTALNVVGDSATSIYVAKSEGVLNEDVYNAAKIIQKVVSPLFLRRVASLCARGSTHRRAECFF